MLQITSHQYSMIASLFSFTIAAFGAATLFLIQQRAEMTPRYRVAVSLLSVVDALSALTYWRLLQSWDQSFGLTTGGPAATGHIFEDTVRIGSWLLTFPLTMIALVQLLDLPSRQTRLRGLLTAFLAAETVMLSYPALTASHADVRWLWWAASMLPFLLLTFQLYAGFGRTILDQPQETRSLLGLVRSVSILVWLLHPLLNALPLVGITWTNAPGNQAFVAVQAGLTLADLLTQGACAILLYVVAARKSQPAGVRQTTNA